MSQVFASWSGGKDSSLAFYRAVTGGLKVRCLLNMVTEDGERSRSHGLSAEVLQVQSRAIGMPKVLRDGYWFREILKCELRPKGESGG